jgi:hypothetical protein
MVVPPIPQNVKLRNESSSYAICHSENEASLKIMRRVKKIKLWDRTSLSAGLIHCLLLPHYPSF